MQASSSASAMRPLPAGEIVVAQPPTDVAPQGSLRSSRPDLATVSRLPSVPSARGSRRVEEDLPLGFVAQPSRRLQATASTDPIMRAERTLFMSQLASEQAARPPAAATNAAAPLAGAGRHLAASSGEVQRLREQLAASNNEVASLRSQLTSRTEEAELLRQQLHRVLDVSKRLLKHVSPALAVEVAHSFAEALVGSVHPRFAVGADGRLAAVPPLAGASQETEADADADAEAEGQHGGSPADGQSRRAAFETDAALAAAFQRAAGALGAIPQPGTAAFPVVASPAAASPARSAVGADVAESAVSPPVNNAMREFQALLAAAGVGVGGGSTSATASPSPSQLQPTPGRLAAAAGAAGALLAGGARTAGTSPESYASSAAGSAGLGAEAEDNDGAGDRDGDGSSMDDRVGRDRGSFASVQREMQDVRGLFGGGMGMGVGLHAGSSSSSLGAQSRAAGATGSSAPAATRSHASAGSRRVLRLDDNGMLVAADASPVRVQGHGHAHEHGHEHGHGHGLTHATAPPAQPGVLQQRASAPALAPAAAALPAQHSSGQGTVPSALARADPHREMDFSSLMRRINSLAARNDAALADTA